MTDDAGPIGIHVRRVRDSSPGAARKLPPPEEFRMVMDDRRAAGPRLGPGIVYISIGLASLT